MISEPKTLYKLMILHMLGRVNFPLTNTQLSDFFLPREYTSYFVLQQALSELLEAGLVHMESAHNASRYDITGEGEDTLKFFGNKIPAPILEEMNLYLTENKFKMRNEVNTTAEYYRSTNHDYIVHFEVREDKAPLISLDLSVPDEEHARKMRDNWKGRSQEIYQFLMLRLMADKD